MKLTPDNFPTVTDDELREFWQRYRDVDDVISHYAYNGELTPQGRLAK